MIQDNQKSTVRKSRKNKYGKSLRKNSNPDKKDGKQPAPTRKVDESLFEDVSAAGDEEAQVFNFGVHKINKYGLVQRRVLQIDFQEHMICNIQNGMRNKHFKFNDIEGCRAEDGNNRVTISFDGHHDYIIHADSVNDKNEIQRLINVIVNGSTTIAANGKKVWNTAKTVKKLVYEGMLLKKRSGFRGLGLEWHPKWVKVYCGEIVYSNPDTPDVISNVMPVDLAYVEITKCDDDGISITSNKTVKWDFRTVYFNDADGEEADRDYWYTVMVKAASVNMNDVLNKEKESLLDVRSKMLTVVQEQLANLVKSHVIDMKQFGAIIDTTSAALKETLGLAASSNEETADGTGVLMDVVDTSEKSTISPHESHIVSASSREAALYGTTGIDAKPAKPDAASPAKPPKPGGVDASSSSSLSSNKPPKSEWRTASSPSRARSSGATAAAPPPAPPPLLPPPPPPMGVIIVPGVPGRPRKEASKAGSKLRPFFWQKLAVNVIPHTFWMDVPDVMPFDMADLERHFDTTETSKTQFKKRENKLTILEQRRAQNLGIFLSGFRLPVDEIDTRLNVYDEKDPSGLPTATVVGLRRVIPTSEEVEAYKSYKGDKSQLGNLDKFMMGLMSVPHVERRLGMMQTIRELPDRVRDIRPKVEKFGSLVKLIDGNMELRRAMAYALGIGNCLNRGTPRDCTYGFSIDSLSQMADVKAKDRDFNMVHFLVKTLLQQEPGVLQVWTQLEEVERNNELSLKVLLAEIQILTMDAKSIEKNLKDPELQLDEHFATTVEEVLETLRKDMNAMISKFKESRMTYKGLLKTFGASETYDSETLFSNVGTFVKQLKNAHLALTKGTKDHPSAREKTGLEASRPGVSLRADDGGNGYDEHHHGNGVRRATPSSAALAATMKAAQSIARCISNGAALGGSRHVSAPPGPTRDTHAPPCADDAAAVPTLDDPTGAGPHPADGDANDSFEWSRSLDDTDDDEPQARGRGRALAETGAEGASLAVLLPTHVGMMTKLSGGKKRKEKWDERYFELSEDSYLYYYKSKGGKCVNSIYVRGCPILYEAGEPTRFQIETEDRLFSLRTETESDCEIWRNKLAAHTSPPETHVIAGPECFE